MMWSDILSLFIPLFIPFLVGFTTAISVLFPSATGIEGTYRWTNFWLTLENLVTVSLRGTYYDFDPNLVNLMGVAGVSSAHCPLIRWQMPTATISTKTTQVDE